MDNGRVGMALFGLGRIGRIHLPNILGNKRVKLCWIVEGNHDVANQVMEEYDIVGKVKLAAIEDIPTVLKDPGVNAIFICSPTDSHTTLTRQALQAGKHVICEKPISENTEDIVACFDDAEKHGVVLMAAFNRHFDPSYRDMYKRVRAGEVGKVTMMKSTFRDTPLWLGAHSVTQTFLIHDIDLLCWFADDLPETVVCLSAANIKEVAEKDDVDCVVITMKFPNGAIGILDFCRYSCYGYDMRMEIFGSDGMLRLEAPLQTTVKSYKDTGNLEAPIQVSFPDRFRESYEGELNHFVDVLTGKCELEVKRAYSERIGFVMNAIKEAYNTGEVVRLKK